MGIAAQRQRADARHFSKDGARKARRVVNYLAQMIEDQS